MNITDEIYDLVIEANKRMMDIRIALVMRSITDTEVVNRLPIATAPLASAAKRIEQLREGENGNGF